MATTKRSASVRDPETEGVQEISEAEGREIFDEVARKTFGISGEDFLRGWDAGEYADAAGHGTTEAEHHAVMRVVMLMGLVR